MSNQVDASGRIGRGFRGGRGAMIGFLLLLLMGLTPASSPAGTFIPTGSLNEPRFFGPPTATLLADGRVLIALGGDSIKPTITAEIYDPASGTFTYTGSLIGPIWEYRQNPSSLLLPNGKVLFAGGNGNNDAEVFNPDTNKFEATGSMNAAREGAASLLLADGRALFVGGHSLSSAEIYDSATGTFTSTGSMGTVRWLPRAALLLDGRVLVSGGSDSVGQLSSAEVFDPETGDFTPTGQMPAALDTVLTATTLNTGKVLVTDTEGDAALYDPGAGTFTLTGQGSAGAARAVLLNSGKVLFVDLLSLFESTDTAEIYDPQTGSFSPEPSRLVERVSAPAVAKLADGRVLIAGGATRQTFPVLYTPQVAAQIYDPDRNDPILTVKYAGSGSGTAMPQDSQGAPAFFSGIRVGTRVRIVAKPHHGSTFAGWQDACAGTGDCHLTMDGDRTVTAVFERISSKTGPKPRRARLAALKVSPRSKEIRRGGEATVRVTVRNVGNAPASLVKVCPQAGSKAVKAGRCAKLGRITPSGSKKVAFRVSVAEGAKEGGRATVVFKATAAGVKAKTGLTTITFK